MTTYPYYIPVRYNAGILRKLFNDKKFKTEDDVIEAVARYAKKPHRFASHFEESQFLILRYTDQYQSDIVGIYNFGNYVHIN